MIMALIVPVNGDPETHPIVPTLANFQSLVGGGYFEAVHIDTHTLLYCNEDAITKRFPVNCEVAGFIIRGPFFLVRDDGTGEEASLTPEQVKTWGDRIREAKATTMLRSQPWRSHDQ